VSETRPEVVVSRLEHAPATRGRGSAANTPADLIGDAHAVASERAPGQAEVHVVVPLRDTMGGKKRLSEVLDPRQRADLAAAMFADTLSLLRQSGVEPIVAAGTKRAARFARRLGAPSLLDVERDGGLRRAVDRAITEAPAGDVAIVMPDLPLLGTTDLEVLFSGDSDVTVASTLDGGTGGLLLRSGVRLRTWFGPHSANAHHLAAIRQGHTARLIRPWGFSFDVDTPADLAFVRDQPGLGPETRMVIGRWNLR
jgi:2-phospho-L-lactate/phosphoenolpyruvate guanylyltransferase